MSSDCICGIGTQMMKNSIKLTLYFALVFSVFLFLTQKTNSCCQVGEDPAPWNVMAMAPGTVGTFEMPGITEWDSARGYISRTGRYQAPSFGILDVDEVTGTGPDGNKVTIWVRVVPNNSTESYKYVAMPAWFTDYQLYTTLMQNSALKIYPGQFSGWESWLREDRTSSDGASIDVVTEGQPVKPVQWKTSALPRSGNTLYPYSYDENGYPMYGATFRMEHNTDQIMRPYPVNSVYPLSDQLPKNCQSGEDALKVSPWSVNAKKGNNWDEIGKVQIHVDLGLGKAVKDVFGISLEIGGYWEGIARTRSIDYTRSRIEEVYRCENKKWVLKERRRCYQLSTGVETIPIWYCLYLGYPPAGAPGPWGERFCKALSLK